MPAKGRGLRLIGVLLLVWGWAQYAHAAPAEAEAGLAVTVAPDHERGVYERGEEIVFRVTVTRDGEAVTEGTVDYEIRLNDFATMEEGSAELSADGAAVRTRLSEPGALILKATYTPADGEALTGEVGAVVDPFSIQPSLPAPEDFDEFWAAQKARLAETPMNARLTPVPDPLPDVTWGPAVECFDVQLDCPGGAPVSAYFVRPKDAAPGSLPASVSFHGAGVRNSNLQGAWNQAKRNCLGMDVNAHGLPNGKSREYYNDLRSGEMRDYAVRGIESRETYYFLGMYLRVARALEFLCSQPEWDGRNLIVTGGSQGGAQALVAAGLDERVTLVSAGLPALCDLTAATIERRPGWPFFTSPELGVEYRDTVRYFDVCNFARRARAAAVVRVGLIDHVCPPPTVLGACNQLKGEKYVFIVPSSGHSFTSRRDRAEADEKFREVMERQLAAPAAALE